VFTVVEVAHIQDVKHEIFGSVLHVVRWGGDPMAVIDERLAF
jgi:RHH-type transcriptional regulator, proline utilization regulon repressor / proline dehydrogenase / delta 1-pyrroline-5-carboxylate dehydrogenase